MFPNMRRSLSRNNAPVVKFGKGVRLRSGRCCRFESYQGHQLKPAMVYEGEQILRPWQQRSGGW